MDTIQQTNTIKATVYCDDESHICCRDPNHKCSSLFCISCPFSSLKRTQYDRYRNLCSELDVDTIEILDFTTFAEFSDLERQNMLIDLNVLVRLINQGFSNPRK